MAINHFQRLGGDGVHVLVTIDFDQLPLGPIIIGERQGLPLVGPETFGDHFLAIVTACNKLRAIDVAEVGNGRVQKFKPKPGADKVPTLQVLVGA